MGKKEEKWDDIPDKEELNLDDWEDDLNPDEWVDIRKIKDEMLTDETDKEKYGRDVDEVGQMLRDTMCVNCTGSSSKKDCQIRHDYGCPPDKANK